MPIVLGALPLAAVLAGTLQGPASPDLHATWTSLRVPGGTSAFRCISDLPPRVSRARLLIELGRRQAEKGPDDPLGERLGQYAAWLGKVQQRIASLGTSEVSITARGPADAKHIDDLLDELGFAVHRRRAGVTVDVLAHPDGQVDRFASCLVGDRQVFARRLSEGKPVRVLPDSDDVPMPFSSAAWASMRKGDLDHAFLDLISDRSALFLYTALASADAETLAVVGQPAVLRQLNGASRVFAAYAGAIRIRGGAIDVPGGDAFGPAWEKLVGHRRAEPVEFIRSLLNADDGRLAYFYAMVDRFPPERLRALWPDDRDGPQRVYDRSSGALSAWVPAQHPMSVPDFDPLVAARDITIDATGRPVGPQAQSFWRAVFELDEVPDRPERVLRSDDTSKVSLPWLLNEIFREPQTARQRYAAVRFAQRVFPGSESAGADVLVATVASKRLPALVLSLERMGVRDPAIYAAVVRAARRITTLNSANTAVRQWQGAIALIEALRRTSAIDTALAGQWLTEAAKWEPQRNNGFADAVTAWIQASVSPILPPASAQDPVGTAERQLYLLISGPLIRSDTSVMWEGLTYVAAPAEAQARRAVAIARLQARPPLADVMALVKATTRLAGTPTAGDVALIAQELTARLPRFKSPLPPWALDEPDKPVVPADVIGLAIKDMQRVRKDRDVRRLRRHILPLSWLGGQLMGDVLPALVYTGRLAGSAGPVEQYVDLWRRHDFGLEEPKESVRREKPWRVPEQGVQEGGGIRASGSLLGFDLAFGRSLMRRIGGGEPPRSGEIPPALTGSLEATMALLAGNVTSGDRELLQETVGALKRGREVWAKFLSTGIVPAGWRDPLRANVLTWMTQHEPSARDGEISLTELAQLGAPDGLHPNSFLGISSMPSDGCWCLRVPSLRALLVPGDRALANTVSDVTLRVAEIMTELRMPGILLPSMAAAGFGDLIDQLDPVHGGDWQAVSEAVRRLGRDRLEQLLFSLVATRELVVSAPKH